MVINKKWFIDKIQSFLLNDESNKMTLVDNSLIYDPDILVGVVSGNDPIFEEYKKIIGHFHLTPSAVYNWYCSKYHITPNSIENISVIAYILPFNKDTKKQHLEYSKEWPCARWAHSRLFGELANEKLQKFLVEELHKAGVNAIAPSIENELFRMLPKFENSIWVSTWSHRHMAFAAGLGSFGLSDGFINEKGIAMRCGSIVVDFKLPSDATNRPKGPYDLCNNCGICIERCPAGALSFETRHDKIKCANYCFKTTKYIKKNFNIDIYACGLCQVGVPCEDGLPARK
jgi:epoxyqueuosine reductase